MRSAYGGNEQRPAPICAAIQKKTPNGAANARRHPHPRTGAFLPTRPLDSLASQSMQSMLVIWRRRTPQTWAIKAICNLFWSIQHVNMIQHRNDIFRHDAFSLPFLHPVFLLVGESWRVRESLLVRVGTFVVGLLLLLLLLFFLLALSSSATTAAGSKAAQLQQTA